MNQRFYILFLITLIGQQLLAQQETYTVKKAPFSSDKYDEYSPVFYKNGIVFTSDRGSGSFVDYSSSLGKATFNISFIDTTMKVTWRKAMSFSKSLNTPYNDGPVTFNSRGDTIYFCRNLKVEGKLSELSSQWNKLGIFSAVLESEKWTEIREMRFNSEWYNNSTPWLSSDGRKLYFASDKPGGYGGSDIYFSELKNGFWTDPVNMGPVINTKGNEAYPFINPAGELLFASDGHPGLGGKDIFFSRSEGNSWLPPVRLDPPINSTFDDFAIITDSLMNEGYFSSNRDNSTDIFRFKTNFPQIFYTDIQKENQSCFWFSDSGSIVVDTLKLKYIWDFGDGKKASGAQVSHCFQGPGKYEVKLNIIDRATGKLFFSKLSYVLDLKDFEQPYINSPVSVVTGDTVNFDGLRSLLTGYKIISYSWDFGNGNRMQGESVKYTFKKSGEYNVNLGLKLQSLSTGVVHNTGVTKKILVFNTPQEETSFLAKNISVTSRFPKISEYDKTRIKTIYSAEEEFKKEAEFQVVLISSRTRIALNSSTFRNVPAKYSVKEIFDAETGLFSYIIDKQMSLMAAYPAYIEMIASGYRDAVVRIIVLEEPPERELYTIKKNYGFLTDTYFDAENMLTTSAYIMLDQVVNLLNKYPAIKLEIGVHTDNQGAAANLLWLSQIRAQVLMNYLINRGISSNRLTFRGYGGARPVTSNTTLPDRSLNRRIDFTIL